MQNIIRRIKPWHLLVVYLLCYAAISYCTLTRFPFVHSDEAWLSGLTRNMLAKGSVSVTEPFFDLKLRYPHAIKTLFHLGQGLMLQLLGYQVGTFRLLSLLGGLAALCVFYAIIQSQQRKPWVALVGTILLSVDVQFVYASHFARAEIWILLGLLGCYLALSGVKRHPLIAAVITGLCIGIHPNSFIIAGMCGALFVLNSPLAGWRATLKSIAAYGGIVAAFLLAVIGLSLWMDPQFFSHYFGSYGADYQVQGSLLEKLAETVPYFQRLYQQVSGTYYTPDIRLQLAGFVILLVISCALLGFCKKPQFRPTLSAIFGIWAALVLMGRFGQPYVVFFFPFGYLLAVQLCSLLGARQSLGALGALTLVVGWLTAGQVMPVAEQPEQYDRYLAKIASIVPPDAKTLGNLNAEYHFENEKLLDYRNLPYLAEAGLSVSEYLQSRKVEYIIYSTELELLYSLRSRWDHIYGELSFLPELLTVLDEECTLLYRFVDNQYANRVVSYQYTGREFTVSIYRFEGAP